MPLLSTHERQKRVELDVFTRFCAAAGRTFLPGTLRQPDPPAPDIVVSMTDLGDVAFELTDISPPGEIRRRNVLHRTPDAFVEHLEKLPVEVQRAFDAKYANAVIFPSMTGLGGDRDLRKRVPAVFDALLSLPDAFEGSVAEAGIELPPATISLCIYRSERTKGPAFNAIGASLLPRLNIAALSNKFSKRYTLNSRCELLAWIGDGAIFHQEDNDELPRVIKSSIGKSIFDCVWVYEIASESVQEFERS